MVLSSAELTAWIGTYLWPLFRIAAFISAAPIFGVRFLPVRVKTVLAIALTLFVSPLLTPVPFVDPLSVDGVLIIVQQVIIGLAMGLGMNLVFSVFVIGGQIVALNMGLGFASMVDPQMGTQVPVISQFYIILVTLTFLGFNGHLALIELLVESFKTLPISTQGLTPNGYWQLVHWGTQMFQGAVMVALPATAALLMVNFALGIIMRAAPQFNIMSIGFPVTLTLGFVIIIVTLPILLPAISQQAVAGFELIRVILSRS